MPPSLAERIWDFLSRRPLASALAVLLLQTAFTLDSRSLWFSDEVRYANVYENLVRAGKWLVLSLNGDPYPDKPPVYFWLLRLLDLATPFDPPALFFLGAAVSAGIYLWATASLARTLGFSRQETLAAGLVLLTTFLFAGLAHYSRMDLLFAALIVGAQACFYKGFTGSGGRVLTAGFGLIAAAILTKGPLALAFPLLAAVGFLAWRGELGRLRDRGLYLGLAVLAAVSAAWLLGAWLTEGPAFIADIFGKQIYQRAVSSFHHKEPFFYYFLAFPPAWLPWTLLLPALPLRRLADKSFWTGLPARRREAPAETWLWAALLSGFAFLCLLSIKVLVYILPLFAPLALLTARRLLVLPEPGRVRLWTAVGGLLLFLSAAAPLAEGFIPLDLGLKGLGFTTLLLGGCGVLLLLQRHRTAPAPLLTLTLAVSLWMIPANLLTAPGLDPVMSPRQTGELMRAYVDQGYFPAAHKIYSGVFTYYAGRHIVEVGELDQVRAILSAHPKTALIMQKKYWEAWTDRPEGLVAVHEQFMADRRYVLVLQGK